jgi:hypothetical protein
MAPGLGDVLITLQNGVTAIYTLRQQLRQAFPQATLVSTAVRDSTGTILFDPTLAVGFMSVTTSSGFVGWVPVYPSS